MTRWALTITSYVVEMQVLLVNAPEATEICTEGRTCAFAGVAMHLPSSIVILIPRPLVGAMAHGLMGGDGYRDSFAIHRYRR